MQHNAKAISVLHCALNPNEFNRISACKSAKEIWMKLQVAHEGTSEVRETKINMSFMTMSYLKWIQMKI